MTWIASSFQAFLETAAESLASDPGYVLQDVRAGLKGKMAAKKKKTASRKAAATKKTVAKKKKAGEALTFDSYLARVRTIYDGLELDPPAKNRPAKATELAAIEKALGHALPAGLRAVWLVANGAGDSETAPVFWTRNGDCSYELTSVAEAKSDLGGFAKLSKQYVTAKYADPEPRDPRIAPGWFLPGWLPFADFAGGTFRLFVDFAPSAKGIAGQILAYTHDPDEMTWIAPSFDAFLAQSIATLESMPEWCLDGPLDRRSSETVPLAPSATSTSKNERSKKDALTFERYVERVRKTYEVYEEGLEPPARKKPAKASELAALESALGYALPVELRNAWLATNGSEDEKLAPLFWRDGREFPGYALLSVAEAEDAHAELARLGKRHGNAKYEEFKPRDERIVRTRFSSGWLPFAKIRNRAVRLLIDFTPSPKGVIGQVVEVTRVPASMTWVASSFDEYLVQSIAVLESGPSVLDYAAQAFRRAKR